MRMTIARYCAGLPFIALSALICACPIVCRAQDDLEVEMPSADEIIQLHFDATGGLDKYNAIKTLRFDGELEFDGRKGKINSVRVTPNRIRTHRDVTGLQSETTTFNGKIGWIRRGDGEEVATAMVDRQIEEAMVQSPIVPLLKIQDLFSTVECTKIMTFHDQECYVVFAHNQDKMEPQTPDESIRKHKYLFSIESKRLVGIYRQMLVNNDEYSHCWMTTRGVLFSDYREVEGIEDLLLSFQETRIFGSQEQTIQWDSIEVNRGVPRSYFDIPDEITEFFGFQNRERDN